MKELLRVLWGNKKVRAGFFFVVILIVGLFIFRYFALSQQYSTPKTQTLPLSSNTHAQVVGNDIYSFDGLVFSKTDPLTSKRTVLSRPVRYPTLDSVWYLGDKGALATFKGSFDSTPAEKYVYAQDLLELSEVAIIQNYLWYIDFSSGDITLVSSDYADKKLAFWDASSQKAYVFFVRTNDPYEESDSGELPNSNIVEFDLATKKLIQSYDAGKYVDVVSMMPCTGAVFCVTGTLEDDTNALSSFSQGKLSPLSADSYAAFTPTNNPSLFILTKLLLSDKQLGSLTDDDSAQGPYSVSLFNVETKKATKTSTTIIDNGGLMAITDGENLSVFHNENSVSVVSVYAKNRLGWFVSKNVPTKIDTPTLGQPSYAVNGHFGIIQAADDSYVSFGAIDALPAYGNSHYRSVLGQCVNNDESFFYNSTEKKFYISLIYDPGVQTRIDSLASCLYKDTVKLSAVSFRIILLSPSTGQVVSN